VESFGQPPVSHEKNPGHIVLAEFLGCGESSIPSSENQINIETFAEHFISLVQCQNWGLINLVGHSTGGLIVAYMLAKSPKLFHQAVLLDPVGAKGISTFTPMMKNIFERMKNDRSLVSFVLAAAVYQTQEQSDFFQNVIVEDAYTAVKNVGYGVVQALSGLNSATIYKSISHRVLVLHGEFDALLPLEDSKEAAGLMQNGEFRIIPGRGHCTNIEDPELFVGLTAKFLFNT
jgi:3-oxoadipate enol-lactonase